MIEFLVDCAQAGGAVLERHFGRLTNVRTKENASSVVTEADLASERCIFDRIRARFPDDGLLGEESGYAPGRSDRVWVVDPLDGTSNFVAGLPWFGVMIALLDRQTPVLAALHLPAMNSLYTAELGRGARRNGEPVRVTAETDLARVLMGFGLDASADAAQSRREALLLAEVARRARNIRATNSLVDFCYTADGRLGGAVNLACKIWDIAAPVLLLREAGGVVTNLAGQEPDFRLDDAAAHRTHTMLCAPPALHRQLRGLVAEAGRAEILR
jgi:myo-inositol-1(or 4)-monophosphatase